MTKTHDDRPAMGDALAAMLSNWRASMGEVDAESYRCCVYGAVAIIGARKSADHALCMGLQQALYSDDREAIDELGTSLVSMLRGS